MARECVQAHGRQQGVTAPARPGASSRQKCGYPDGSAAEGRGSSRTPSPPSPRTRKLSHESSALDARRGVCRHGDAHARHRGGQHRPLADRRGPRRRPQRPAVGRRRLHARARRDRADLRLARRPLRSSPAVRRRPCPLHRRFCRLRRRPEHRSAGRGPRRAGHRRGGHVRRLARPARERLPGRQGARRGAGRLRRRHRRLVRRRPARGRRADQRAGLAVDLPHQPAARAAVPVDHPRLRRRVARSGRPPGRRARADHAAAPGSSCSCSRCCAATRTAGRAPRSWPRSRSPPRCWRPSWPSRRRCASRCCRSGSSATATSPARRWRRWRSRPRSSRSSSTSRSTSSRCWGSRPSRPGSSTCRPRWSIFTVSGATAALGEKVSARAMIAVGLALVGAGMALMVLAGPDSSWTALLPGFLVAAVGTGLFNPAVTAVALGSAPPEQSGLAAGVNDTFRQAGIAVGIAALGALVPAEAALGGGSPVDYVERPARRHVGGRRGGHDRRRRRRCADPHAQGRPAPVTVDVRARPRRCSSPPRASRARRGSLAFYPGSWDPWPTTPTPPAPRSSGSSAATSTSATARAARSPIARATVAARSRPTSRPATGRAGWSG